MASRPRSTERASGLTAEEVDLQVAHAAWAAGDTVVDVRLPEEYVRGHIPGALNVPVDRIPLQAKALPEGQLVTVCSTGNRSWRAAQALDRAGREALSLCGGTKAWAAAGLPIARGPQPGSAQPGGRLSRVFRLLRSRRG